MELRIYLRQTQYRAFESTPNGLTQGDPVIYTGLNPSLIKPTYGVVPKPDYIDFTDYCANLDKLSIEWTTERDSYGNLTFDRYNKPKSASGTLEFEGEAYHFINEWLRDNVGAPMNTIDVKIEHVGVGSYVYFIIKPTQVEWCDDGECRYEITLQSAEDSYHCIAKTLVDDNHQGWFHKHTTKKHPRFVACNEKRPNGMLITFWWLACLLFTFIVTLTPVINSIIAIIGVIKTIINAIKWLTGKKVDWSNSFNWFDPEEMYRNFFSESMDCGHAHPAPLVRDLIYNACLKCGVNVDAVSAPIFFDKMINIDTSSEREQGVKTRRNPYYNACYLPPIIKDGYRKYNHLFGQSLADVYYWNEGNNIKLALSDFLDDLKTLFNAEWRLQNNASGHPTLYFWRKDWFYNGKLLYNFQTESDRIKILKGMCYTWNDAKLPAFMSGAYDTDGSDTCGDTAKVFMNDKVSIGSSINNKLFEGEMSKTSKFGATKFRQDGIESDALMDAYQTLRNGGISLPFIIDTVTGSYLRPILKSFDYALLLSPQGKSSKPKIIIWDGVDYDEAKAYNQYAAMWPSQWAKDNNYTDADSLRPPYPNQAYNPELKDFFQLYDVDVRVKSVFNPDPSLRGYYEADKYFVQARLVNYPMYFSSKFKNNLFDFFHWIDDPNVKPKANQSFEVSIDLCDEDLKKLGVFDGMNNIALLERVKTTNPIYSDGIITEISVNYDSEDNLGKHITIKGQI